jgi:hypothetical protein
MPPIIDRLRAAIKAERRPDFSAFIGSTIGLVDVGRGRL